MHDWVNAADQPGTGACSRDGDGEDELTLHVPPGNREALARPTGLFAHSRSDTGPVRGCAARIGTWVAYRRPVLSALPLSPTATRRPQDRGRLAALDLLRFGAALAVVAFHLTARRNDAFGVNVWLVFPHVGDVTAFGALGVQLFFIISGFVILMSVWGRSPQEFVASRVSRLFPAYWCAAILTAAMTLLLRPAVLGSDLRLSDAVANLTMVQSAFGVQDIDGVYWTLYAELRFYLLVGLLAVVGLTRTRVIAFAVGWPIAAGIAQTTDSTLVAHVLNGSNASFFAAGMVMYLMYREGQSVFLWLLLVMQWAIAMHTAGTNLTASMLRNTGRDVPAWVVMAAVTVVFALVLLATMSPVGRLSSRWMTFCGSLTYPLYLIHEHWGWVTIAALHGRIGQLPALVVAVVVLVLAATAIHLWVERPLAPRLRTAVRRGLAPSPATAAVPGQRAA